MRALRAPIFYSSFWLWKDVGGSECLLSPSKMTFSDYRAEAEWPLSLQRCGLFAEPFLSLTNTQLRPGARGSHVTRKTEISCLFAPACFQQAGANGKSKLCFRLSFTAVRAHLRQEKVRGTKLGRENRPHPSRYQIIEGKIMMCTCYCRDDCLLAPWQPDSTHGGGGGRLLGGIPADTMWRLWGRTCGIFRLVAYMKHERIKGGRPGGAARYGGNAASSDGLRNRPRRLTAVFRLFTASATRRLTQLLGNADI